MVEAGHARSALERASLLDLAPGARVAVLVRQGAELQGESLARAEERLMARLQAVGGTLSRIEPAMDEDLLEAFERQAAQDAPELVIIAREPRGRLTRLLGDTPEKLARHGRVPVLVTRLPAEAPYRRVLVGIDYSENAREALELALRLTPPEAGPLDVLHCYDTSYALVLHQEGASAKQMVDYYRRRASEADAGLRAFLQPYRDQGTDLHALVRSGDPQAELEHAVREQETELLVVGKHGGHGLMHALLGSVAEACLRRAECDVLVVPQAVSRH
ncbi:universal stress family protein [Corallococcus coralloides]|uniref:Universal stress family protein n=1 Tax=Corallococcus coralloides TaxID=184914 RepID=A0A410RIP8_CORCK|nr:universal stress protein [Corallococcus coralloides]QAT81812.1 universal stress family protein [Corallococcus coralloides]